MAPPVKATPKQLKAISQKGKTTLVDKPTAGRVASQHALQGKEDSDVEASVSVDDSNVSETGEDDEEDDEEEEGSDEDDDGTAELGTDETFSDDEDSVDGGDDENDDDDDFEDQGSSSSSEDEARKYESRDAMLRRMSRDGTLAQASKIHVDDLSSDDEVGRSRALNQRAFCAELYASFGAGGWEYDRQCAHSLV